MLVSELISKFLEWNARHRKPATVKHYRDRLASFLRTFATTDFVEITPLAVDEWLHDAGHWPAEHPTKAGEEKAPDTRRANIVAFEALQTWAVKNRLLEKRIVEPIEKPRGRLRERIPTEEECAKILELASPEFGLIYRALRQCGARPNELCRATIADWHRDKHAIILADHKTATKTGKPRVIEVGKKLASILLESIRATGSGLQAPAGTGNPEPEASRTAGPLFLTKKGRAWTPAHLSDQFRTIRNKAGLDRTLVLYLTRHEFATKLVRANVNIMDVAASLGHTNFKTTEKYLHANRDDVRNAQDAA